MEKNIQLNLEQANALHMLLSGKNVFLTGEAGVNCQSKTHGTEVGRCAFSLTSNQSIGVLHHRIKKVGPISPCTDKIPA